MMPTISNLSLSIGAILVLLVLWRWQRSHPSFDLADLITGDNGRVSATKTLQVATWAVVTWGFITIVQRDKLTEWYLTAYLGLSYGYRLWKESLSKPTLPPA